MLILAELCRAAELKNEPLLATNSSANVEKSQRHNFMENNYAEIA